MPGSVAEWCKALALGTFGGVGSNPTADKFAFFFASELHRIKLDWNTKVRN